MQGETAERGGGLRLSPEGVIPRNSHLAPLGLRVQPPGRLLRTARVAVGSLDSLPKLDTDRAQKFTSFFLFLHCRWKFIYKVDIPAVCSGVELRRSG